MDTTIAITEFEAALLRQAQLAADDDAITEAAGLLLESLRPAARQLAFTLAEQAAVEAGAQLPDYEVTVVISDGEPGLQVSPRDPDIEVGGGGHEARITVRLPDRLKDLIEQAAGDSGDSVNSWVINTLASKTHRRRGSQVRGSIDI